MYNLSSFSTGIFCVGNFDKIYEIQGKRKEDRVVRTKKVVM